MKYVLCFALFVVAVSAGGLIAPVHHAAVLPVHHAPVLPVHKVVGVPLGGHIQPVHGLHRRSAIPLVTHHNTVIHPAAALVPAVGAGLVHGVGAGLVHGAGLVSHG